MWRLDVNAGIWTDLLEMLVCFSIKIIASGMVLPLKLSNCYQHSGSNMPTSSHKNVHISQLTPDILTGAETALCDLGDHEQAP